MNVNQQCLKTGQSNGQSNSQVVCELDTLTINIFFDGTGNNMYNIEDFMKYEGNRKIPKNSSYNDSDFSNIAYFFQCGEPDGENIRNMYVQGSGTNNWRQEHPEITDETKIKFDKDDNQGLGFGSGKYGITKRVEQTINELAKVLIEAKCTNKLVYLNVFGFSRGATAARHFSNVVLGLNTKLKCDSQKLSKAEEQLVQQVKPWQLHISFVGLFDTVSSFEEGMNTITISLSATHRMFNTDYLFNDDREELNLMFQKSERLGKVFHICAADEYRKNFSLTSIDSAVAAKFGFEVIMTGAHSDIGGGYLSTENPTYSFNGHNQKEWLIKKGFFNENDVYDGYRKGWFCAKHGGEKGKNIIEITNEYQRIPFKTMRLVAEKYAINFKQGLVMDIVNEKEKFAVSEAPSSQLFKELMARIPKAILKSCQAHWESKPDAPKQEIETDFTIANFKSWQDDEYGQVDERIRAFRYRYIHWSVRNSIGKGVRLNSSGIPERELYKG